MRELTRPCQPNLTGPCRRRPRVRAPTTRVQANTDRPASASGLRRSQSFVLENINLSLQPACEGSSPEGTGRRSTIRRRWSEPHRPLQLGPSPGATAQLGDRIIQGSPEGLGLDAEIWQERRYPGDIQVWNEIEGRNEECAKLCELRHPRKCVNRILRSKLNNKYIHICQMF